VIVGWQASNYQPGNYLISSFSKIGFVNMANGDYRFSLSGPYRNRGAGGKNIGFDLSYIHASPKEVTAKYSSPRKPEVHCLCAAMYRRVRL
jgi:hypothetical protein